MSELEQKETEEQKTNFTEEIPTSKIQYQSVAPNAPPRQQVRRVGTFTMGLSLIAAGVIALICLFSPTFDIFSILRFAPIVLIFLGIEILLSHLLHRNDRLKYDFLSGFVCFILICASVGAALLPPLFEQFGPGREKIRGQISNQIRDLCYGAMGTNKNIQSLYVTVYLNGGVSEYSDASYQSLLPTDQLHLTFTLAGDYADPQQFAQGAREVLNQLQTLSIQPSRVRFEYEDNTSDHKNRNSYELELGNPFSLHQDAQGLARMVTASDSEWLQLEEERQELYDDVQQERTLLQEELQEERQQLYAEMEEQRTQLSDERDQMYAELETRRTELEKEFASS